MIDVSQMTDRDRLRQLMANTRLPGNRDKPEATTIYWSAFKRLCELEGLSHDEPLERDFAQVLAAYEELLAEKHGRRQPAGYTRRKVANKGVVRTLEDWALAPKATDGFKLLIKNKMPELTGEALVIKYPDRFSARAVAAAKKRLQGADT